MRVFKRKVSGQAKISGFSYIEMVFTVAILALIASAATPYLEKTIMRNKELELKQNLREIRTAIDAYKNAADQGKIQKNLQDSGYPKKLEDLAIGVVDITDPKRNKIKFLREIPADPMYSAERSSERSNEPIAAATTWGTRSYESDSSDPRSGADVYDVYSLSTQKGLNGISYNQW